MKGLNELTGAGTHKCQETGVKVGSHALIRGDLVSRRILDDLNGPNQTRTRIQGYLISQDNPPVGMYISHAGGAEGDLGAHRINAITAGAIKVQQS